MYYIFIKHLPYTRCTGSAIESLVPTAQEGAAPRRDAHG